MPSPYDPSASAQPQLGYGQRGAASLDAFNQWFRARPEYYAKLKQFGQDPTNVHLNDAQKQEMVRLAQSLGAVVDEGHDGQEVDDSGNFRAKSHKLRNTLIVAGIAGAALATAGLAGAFAPAAAGATGGVEAGATAGLGAAALPGAGTALGGAGFTAVGAPLASAAAAGGAAADVGAGAAAPAVAGSTLPAATYGAGGAVTNFAASPAIAGAAGTPMLESILRYGVPTVGNLVGGIIQANASGKASDAQQRYLEEALAYQKEQDAYNRKTAAEHYDYSKNTEASRYGDYTNNIAGYVATGNSANARMASLLGLPPNAPMTGSSMPKVSAASVPAVTGVAPSPGVTTQPQTRTNEPMVTMQGPDGSQKQVPSSQVDHYKQIGATVIGQAA